MNQIDLRQYVERAWDKRLQWSRAEAARLAAALARAVSISAQVEWDDEAGEDWARVFVAGEVQGLVSLRLPFVFISEAIVGQPRELLAGSQAEVVVMTHWEDRAFKGGGDELVRMFGRGAWRGLIDMERFSPAELYHPF